MRFLKFWGTRGSCPVSGPQFSKYGGNTVCLEVRYDDTRFIIDAGTGIRALGIENQFDPQEEINIFLSHAHLDHIIGLPFFEPAFHQDQKIALWLPGNQKSGKEIFTQFLTPEVFPGGFNQLKADISFHPAFEETPIQIGKITLQCCRVCHPGITFGFKIITPSEKIGYVTDHEFLQGYTGPFDQIPTALLEKDKKVIDFFRDVDLLIHEAQFSIDEYQQKKNWGHSNLLSAFALIQEIKIKKWFVVHHDPKHTDQDLEKNEQLAKQTLSKTFEVRWIPDGFLHTLR